MLGEIPILVRRDQLQADFICRESGASIFQKIKAKRTPTAPKMRPREQPSKLQTLDPDQRTCRTRRISSSTASRRFPKDFFKEELPANPIKSSKLRHKKYEPNFLDTFSHKHFAVEHPDYLLPQPEDTEEGTPKFTEKKKTASILNDRLLQRLVQQKIKEPVQSQHSKYSTCPEGQTKSPLQQATLLQNSENHCESEGLLVSNFNLTLGMKDTLHAVIEKGHRAKRKREPIEKENKAGTVKATDLRGDSAHKVEGFRIRRKILV